MCEVKSILICWACKHRAPAPYSLADLSEVSARRACPKCGALCDAAVIDGEEVQL